MPSARPGPQKAFEWRGRPDGTYSLKTLERDAEPGTRVYLRAKEGCAALLGRERVEELARHYGGLLPIPVRLAAGSSQRELNDPPPWRTDHRHVGVRHLPVGLSRTLPGTVGR